MARIDLNNLAHAYVMPPHSESDFALKTLNLTLEDGEAYALLGPSGCGKTTLLNIISGLLAPAQGTVRFNGEDVTLKPPEARNIAQVFQFPVIYDTMTVFENLAFPLKNRGVAKQKTDGRVRRMAQMLDLSDRLNRAASNLSADEKQKISLGRGLIREDVAAILFDEPLTVIDPQLKWALRSQLKRLHAEFNHTMIYVTHDQTEALTFADHVIVMSEGNILQIGSPEELFERPAHTFVGRFIGSPGMNLLPCEVKSEGVSIAGQFVRLPGANVNPAPASSIEIGIRPEFVKFSTDGDALPVTIDRVEDAGRRKIVRLRLSGLELAAILAENAPPIPPDPCIRFEADKIRLYADSRLMEQGV